MTMNKEQTLRQMTYTHSLIGCICECTFFILPRRSTMTTPTLTAIMTYTSHVCMVESCMSVMVAPCHEGREDRCHALLNARKGSEQQQEKHAVDE